MHDDGPSFLAMIALVAFVVATVILVFFGVGYALGKAGAARVRVCARRPEEAVKLGREMGKIWRSTQFTGGQASCGQVGPAPRCDLGKDRVLETCRELPCPSLVGGTLLELFAHHLRALGGGTRQQHEPGTLVYTFHTVDDDPDIVVSYELFTDQDALAVHRDSPTVTRVIPELRAITSPGSVQRLVPAIGKGLAQ